MNKQLRRCINSIDVDILVKEFRQHIYYGCPFNSARAYHICYQLKELLTQQLHINEYTFDHEFTP